MITMILSCLIANILFLGTIGLVIFLYYKKNGEKINDFIVSIKAQISQVKEVVNAIKSLEESIEAIKSKFDKLPFKQK